MILLRMLQKFIKHYNLFLQVQVLLLIVAVTLAGGDISLPKVQSRRDWLLLHRRILM